jgi:hypothetical protein
MALALSVILAVAALALRLKLQSKLLSADNDADRRRLGKQTIIITLVTIAPVSIGMVIAGFLVKEIQDSFISVGFTLMALTLTILIQGNSLNYTGEKAKSYGRKINIYAMIFFYTCVLAIAAMVIRLILALFGI